MKLRTVDGAAGAVFLRTINTIYKYNSVVSLHNTGPDVAAALGQS